jgi:hypothetical protein
MQSILRVLLLILLTPSAYACTVTLIGSLQAK